MKVGGIIAEYNPFHNGHRFQIEEFKKNHGITHLVVVMSGNFVQRGAPAIFDKFIRSEFALNGGADLVIELPSFFATQTAEIFSRGAILSLKSLGCVEEINFGSESGDIDTLKNIASFLVFDGRYELFLKKFLSEGENFPKSREKAIRNFFDLEDGFLSMSNNILAIEYIKEIYRSDVSFKPSTIARKSGEHKTSSLQEDFFSASSIRKQLRGMSELVGDRMEDLYLKRIDNSDRFLEKIESLIPDFEYKEIKKLLKSRIMPLYIEDFFSDICMSVIREEDKLEVFFEVNEGLENSIRKKLPTSQNLNEAIDSIRSKRYSKAKIRRCLINILLGIKKDDINVVKNLKSIPYLRVLGFNKKGTEILKKVRQESNIDIIMSPAKTKRTKLYEDKVYKMMLDFDLRSSLVYYQKFYKNNRQILQRGEPDYINLIKKL